MAKVPYIGFGNDKLAKLPKAEKGMLIECLNCGKDHPLQCVKDTEAGQESSTLMFYECGEKLYLGAVAGRLVFNAKPSCSGEI